MSKVGQKKFKWKPKPRCPPKDVPLPPPNEKKIWEILREEKISPTKRYVRKRRIHYEIIIPLIIPWEYLPMKISQAGMGAFGKRRDPNIKIDDGKLILKQGSLHSDTFLSLFQETTKKQSSSYRTDYLMWGSIRNNVGKVVDSHKYESENKRNLCYSVIPKISLGSFRVFEDMIPFGIRRQQTTKIILLEGMSERCSKSDTFINRFFESTNDEKAGSNVMGKKRNIVALLDNGEKIQHRHESNELLPLLFDTRKKDNGYKTSCSYRPIIFNFEEICLSPFDKEFLQLENENSIIEI